MKVSRLSDCGFLLLVMLLGTSGFILHVPEAHADAGRTAGTFQVSQSATAQYNIPLFAPPGPRWIQPAISLLYDSSTPPTGSLGVGWSIAGLGAITRCAKTVAQDGAAAPVTLAVSDGYCINGVRLVLTSAPDTYGEDGSTYETEVFDRTKITAHLAQGNGPGYFTVQAPNGTTYYYGFVDGNGNGANSAVQAEGTQTVLTWLLSKVQDAAGNNYVVNYTTESAQGTALPSQILWTPTSAGAASYQYEMLFNYDANVPQSSLSKYVAGTAVSETQLLSSIQILSGGTVVKDYFLGYQSSPTTGRETLTSVTECADSAQAHCLSPTTVTYSSPAQGVSSAPITAISAMTGVVSAKYDFNGDGYLDLVYTTSSGLYVAFDSANGYGAPVSIGTTGSVLLFGRITGTSQDGMLTNINGTWYYIYWNGSSFTSVSTGIPYDSAGGSDYQLADINGDGLPDLIEVTNTLNQSTGDITVTVLTRINTSSGGSASFSSTVTTGYSTTLSGSSSAALLLPDQQFGLLRSYDFNGDGQDDLALQVSVEASTPIGPIYSSTVFELISSTSASSGTTFTASAIASAEGSGPAVYFGNWNDDICTDFVVESSSQNTLYLSGCDGTAPQSFAIGGLVIGAMDWDGDGRTDLLVENGSTIGVYLSTGSGISELQTTSVPFTSGYSYMTLDVSGDGMDDLGAFTTLKPLTGPLIYYPHNAPPDLATEFMDGWGNYAKPTYSNLAQAGNTNYEPTTGTYPYVSYTGPMHLVSQVSFNDPSGEQPDGYTQTHYYVGALTNVEGRGFAGFASHRVEDSRNNVDTTWSYKQVFPLTGMLSTVTATLGNESSQTLYSLNITPTSTVTNNVNFVFPQNTVLTQYELGSSSTRVVTTTTTSYTFDALGSPLTITKTVTDNDSESVPSYSGDAWTVTTSYIPEENTSTWCLTLDTEVQEEYTTSPASLGNAVTLTKQFTPDTTHCDYTQIVSAPGTSYQLTESLGYDSFGNVSSDQISGSNLASRTTQINWGTTGQLPASVTEPPTGTETTGAQTQFSYDWAFGFLSSVTDPNGVATSWQPDAFGRKQTQGNPDGTSVMWGYDSCTGNGACPGLAQMQTIVTRLDKAGHTIRQAQSYSDAAGRVIEQLSQNANAGSGSGSYTFQSSTYDDLGHLVAQTVPVLESGSSGAPEVTYAYDALNRITHKQSPVNGGTATTSYGYAGRTTTITDANGHTRTLLHDVNGWLRETQDATGYAITLGYDAAGSRNLVTDSQGNTLWSATYQYGIGPFMTSSTDTDLGTWMYDYDALGELTSWTDADGHPFSMTYDALSRPYQRFEPDLFTQWTWGSSKAAYNIGKLASVCTGTGANPTGCNGNGYAESETYDSLGRQQSRAIQIPGNGTYTTYTYSVAYDPTTGLPSTVTYPATSSGFQLQLQDGYTNGILTSITDIADSPNVTLWTANSVDGFGHYLQETLGNGVQVSHQYDPGSGRVSSITAGLNGGSALQNNSYQFDPVGNLIQRQDNNLGLTEDIYPDAANRFGSSQLNGTTNAQNAYDSMGRMTTAVTPSGSATLNYSTQQPGCTYYANAQLHAERSATSGSETVASCYDANGNLIALKLLGITLGTITWTSFNQPLEISEGPSQFSYDHNHQRWQQIWTWNGVQTTTTYIGGLMEEVSTASGIDYRYYVPAGSSTVVYNLSSSTTNQPNYVTTDHLGSSAVITDSKGNLVVKENYSAWGWPRGDNWTGSPTSTEATTAIGVTPRGFTGQEELPATLAVDMNGRVYAGAIGGGVFFSPDPSIPHPTDTRSYNRYAYVDYNPLSYTDPTGYTTCVNQNDQGACAPIPATCPPPFTITSDGLCNVTIYSPPGAIAQPYIPYVPGPIPSLNVGGGGGPPVEGPQGNQTQSSPQGNQQQSPTQQPCTMGQSIDNYLRANGSPMVGQGANFDAIGQAFDIDPRLLVSIAGAESGFGKNITAGQYNAFNWLYHGMNSPFASWWSAIYSVAKGLSGGYGTSYDLTNTSTMYSMYCTTGSTCGAGLSNINLFMSDQNANPNSLGYPWLYDPSSLFPCH